MQSERTPLQERLFEEVQRLKGSPVDGVHELVLDGCLCTESDLALLGQFSSLTLLSMKNCQISSLLSFPSLPKLEKVQFVSLVADAIQLSLNDNHIEGGLDNLTRASALKSLDLSNNPIKHIAEVSKLVRGLALVELTWQKQLADLKELALDDCLVTLTPTYRVKITRCLQQLASLDGESVNTYGHVFKAYVRQD